MKTIVRYLQDYYRSLTLPSFFIVSAFTAILVFCNYYFGIEERLMEISSYQFRFTGFFLLFIFVYGCTWLIQYQFHRTNIFPDRFFFFLLLAAPAIFAGKITLDWFSRSIVSSMAKPWDRYWYMVINWPLKCLLVLSLGTLIWKWGKYQWPVAGMRFKGFNARPYFILLALMVPLIAFASTQADFLSTYPKVQRIGFINPFTQHTLFYQVLYEISYGIDFITIEFFFRGFLILAFVKYAGKAAILPMAVFYCTIHFGKPLFECITSYFGGIILGVVVYNTRSIWGGLIVHLGIAWLMELGAAIGQSLQ